METRMYKADMGQMISHNHTLNISLYQEPYKGYCSWQYYSNLIPKVSFPCKYEYCFYSMTLMNKFHQSHTQITHKIAGTS